MSLAAPVRTVAIIGAGTAGRSFALAVACAGFHVVLEDVMPANLRKAEADFADMADRAGPGRLSLALTVEDAVREADLAIDFVPDELESKLEIFSMIDRMAPPRTILCTPTEALSITDLASCVYRPERTFALRGSLIPGESAAPLRLLYHGSASLDSLIATAAFFQVLGLTVETEVDPDVPMLVKNLSWGNGTT
ncbi:3-hydroxyacyl-CoA dehydrogenase NAD-binding domain-containing protein [Granulicella sp. dw_53]|uniref:3-hydroxyacyl-CoA dehydrogenase NAD-binding domain-containing protein n=1 Tax=Granulicella sp. dw_53 TaxID=2719792 RepID=UPI001BD2ED4C